MKNLIFLKNNKNKKWIHQRQNGAVMLFVVVVFLFLSLSIVSGLVAPTVREFKTAGDSVLAKQSSLLSESGVEDAFYRIKENKPIGSSTSITLNGNTATTSIVDTGGEKTISALGDVSNRERAHELVLTAGEGVSFNYGVQVGQGGITMEGSSGINGSIYANGPIKGSSSSFITGTAISGNAPALSADQTNGIGIPTYNLNFGNVAATQDIAQSFQVSSNTPVSKLSFYIKKVGTPGNETVRIVTDNSGNPSTTNIATGTLVASTVTTSYGWVDAVLSTNPTLSPGITYWIVLDGSTSASSYYTIGANNAGYANGVPKTGRYGISWGATTPATADLFFNVYLGGMTGLIEGSSGSQWNQLHVATGGSGSAQAHTVNYTHSTGSIYCQVGTGNNSSCINKTDPTYQALPVSQGNIDQWKEEAEAGGTISGNYDVSGSNTVTLGAKKITGNLTVGGSGTLYISGTLWVQGNIILSGSGKIRVHSSYGANSGVIVSDGVINNGGSGQFLGSGTAGSFIMVLTTSFCDISFCAADAITVSGSAGSVVLYAANGTIAFTGSANAKEAVGYKMKLSGSAVVNYDSGLANANFASGPSGGWNVTSWKEVQ